MHSSSGSVNIWQSYMASKNFSCNKKLLSRSDFLSFTEKMNLPQQLNRVNLVYAESYIRADVIIRHIVNVLYYTCQTWMSEISVTDCLKMPCANMITCISPALLHDSGNWNCLFQSSPVVGLISQFSPFYYFPHFQLTPRHPLAIVYPVYIWQVSPQLRFGDTREIWMWFKEYRESNR